MKKIRFLLCLLAICYTFLGERILAVEHFDAAEAARPPELSTLGKGLMIGYLLSQFVVPTMLVEFGIDAVRGNSEPVNEYKLTDEEVREIRSSILRLRAAKRERTPSPRKRKPS